jgi:tetratricopeptide (TPR) repeat protein
VLFETKEYQECVAISLKAAELGREIFADFKIIARAYARVGNAYAKLDDYPKAVTYMEKSLTEFRSPDVLEKLRQFEKLKKEGEVEAYHSVALSDEVSSTFLTKGPRTRKCPLQGKQVCRWCQGIHRSDQAKQKRPA